MIEIIVSQLKYLSQVLPIEIFTFIGTLVEEFIGPIPSPLILIAAGSLAHTQGYHLLYIIILSLIASFAKTLVSWIFYFVADKTENLIFHRDFEKIRHYFDGSKKDDIIIFFARAIPIMPTALISLGCGFIKLDVRSFITATFYGFAVRSFIFLYFGYFGITSYESWKVGQFNMPYLEIGIFVILIILLVLSYIFRHNFFSKKTPKR